MTDSRQLTSMRGSCATACAASMRSARSCGVLSAFSGLPGVTSHHTRSSFKRLMANKLIARWAKCGGSNEPPSNPMRMPLTWGGRADATDSEAREALFNGATACIDLFLPHWPDAKQLHRSRPGLSGPVDAIFETGQLLRTDRTAGMKPAGRNPDLRAEA